MLQVIKRFPRITIFNDNEDKSKFGIYKEVLKYNLNMKSTKLIAILKQYLTQFVTNNVYHLLHNKSYKSK